MIPFLNYEKFLSEAIESVCNQTLRDWELFLIDDGSIDGSSAMAKRYAREFPDRIHYLEHPDHENRGTSASRNLGFKAARGRYLAMLDADDVWLPKKLEKQVALMEQHPTAGMLCGASEYWFSWSKDHRNGPEDYIQYLEGPPGIHEPPSLFKVFLRKDGTVPVPCSVLLRREVARQVGGFEETFRHMHDDQAFYAKIALRFPVLVSNGCWEKYRQHPDSICHTSARNGTTEVARESYLIWVARYLESQRITDTELIALVRKERLRSTHPRLLEPLIHGKHLMKTKTSTLKKMAWSVMPSGVFNMSTRIKGVPPTPPPGQIHFGTTRRLTPISRAFGSDRGKPIDRYYIEKFLDRNSWDIRGHAMEIGDDEYTRKFGGGQVEIVDVLHVTDDNPKATIIGDITTATHIPTACFDCVVFTQTLHLIYDFKAAMETLRRILKPGGVLLATFPGISNSGDPTWESYWNWGFTRGSAKRLFEEFFPPENLSIQTAGNVFVVTSFLQGIAAEELTEEELSFQDPSYDLVIMVRAQKPDEE